MSFHRVIIAALAALFVTGTASTALADCGGCGWGSPAVFAYQPRPLYVSSGCGGCGQLAVTYAPVVYAPVAYAPVAYAPPAYAPAAPAPIAVDHWDTGGWGGCGCGSCGCGRSALYAVPAPAPIYVVNQGPEYTGPGVMVPYGTYSPEANLAAPGDYPYVSHPGYGHGYGYGVHRAYGHPYYRGAGPRFAYRERGYAYPHHYGVPPYGHRYFYPHRPLGVRG